MKIIFSYWGAHACEKEVNFLETGFTFIKNTK